MEEASEGGQAGDDYVRHKGMEADSEGGQAEAAILGTADEVAYFRVALGGKPDHQNALLEKMK